MPDKVDWTNLYDLLTRGLAAVEKEDVPEMLGIIKKFQEGDFGDRKMVNDAIKSYVAASSGSFWYRDICHALHLVEKNDKNNASKILSRMVERGELVKTGAKNSEYRKPEDELSLMNWKNADTTGLDIKFPLEIEKMVKIFPKSIIVVAGVKDGGKTSICLEFARLNKDKHDIYYFNSEMGEEEMRYRLELFDIPLETWDKNFYAYPRTENFAEVIRPDNFNVIDFLEITSPEDFVSVADKIKKIYEALDKGIALIAIQKTYGRDTGRGDTLSLEKARLYLSVNRGIMKIVSAKNWVTHENPNGKIMHFALVNGSKFIPQGEWASEEVYEGFKPRQARF